MFEHRKKKISERSQESNLHVFDSTSSYNSTNIQIRKISCMYDGDFIRICCVDMKQLIFRHPPSRTSNECATSLHYYIIAATTRTRALRRHRVRSPQCMLYMCIVRACAATCSIWMWPQHGGTTIREYPLYYVSYIYHTLYTRRWRVSLFLYTISWSAMFLENMPNRVARSSMLVYIRLSG